MNGETVAGAVLAVICAVYLIYVLLRPERF
jgi:K+-transporting ATPase KdpF subunit